MLPLDPFRNLYAATGGRHPSTLFLCCNGPSLGGVDLAALRIPGALVMGVNNGGHLIRPDLWACVDHPTRFMASIWDDPAILKFVPAGHSKSPLLDEVADVVSTRLVRDCPGVVGYQTGRTFKPATWLSEPRVTYGHGGERFSVLLAALKIAWHLGFRRVYLLGVDWEYRAAEPYFFPEDRTEKHARQNTQLFQTIGRYLEQLRPWFDRAGYEIYNCNPRSGLRVFDHRPLDRALDGVRLDCSGPTRGRYVPRAT
jgi:hypothetical protein